MDKNTQNAILNALQNLQMLISQNNGASQSHIENDLENDPPKNTLPQEVKVLDDLLPTENSNKQKENEPKNAQKTKKIYRKIPKEEKDIYHCINSKGERIGTFYGIKPSEVAQKVASRMYKENEKEIFDVKIYNRITDRFYQYRVQVVPIEKVKIIKGKKIPITNYFKLTRI